MKPLMLWSAGLLKCIVVHHAEAESYRVEVWVRDRVFARRWFDRRDDAATFAATVAVQFRASDVDDAFASWSAARAV